MQKTLVLATLATGALAFQAPEHADISLGAVASTQLMGERGQPLVSQKRVGDAEVLARSAATEQFGDLDLVVTDKYTTKHNGVTHVYFRQRVDGLMVSNGDLNVNIGKDGEILSMGASVLTEDRLNKLKAKLSSAPRVEPINAVKSFLKYAKLYEGEVVPTTQEASLTGDFHSFTFGGDNAMSRALAVPEQTVEARLMYSIDSLGELELTWAVNVESEKPHYAHYMAQMTAATDGESKPIEVYDMVKWFAAPEKAKDATFQVYSMPGIDPRLAPGQTGQGRTREQENDDAQINPEGWHENDGSDTTIGNNIIAQENFDGTSGYINNYRPTFPGANRDMNFPMNLDTQEPREYIDAAVANLWYWNNHFHDLCYAYGWDEVAGNMQDRNFGRGGGQNDALQANAQDGAGVNNANQFTPSDGNRGRQRMYVWTRPTGVPRVDGDLDSGIIIHEYAHSLSNRLTGGPSNAGCLGGGESGGMGEGWGDTLATWWSLDEDTPRDEDFPMGEYAAARGGGIRQYPYSTSGSVNPDTYDDVGSRYRAVHSSGAVWANTLFNVMWDMRDEYGWESNWMDTTSRAGNIVLMQNFIDGMKLQPCRPTMVQARDAIFLADEVNYGSEHYCTMQAAFAARGLGMNARTTSTGSSFGTTTPSFDVDPECVLKAQAKKN